VGFLGWSPVLLLQEKYHSPLALGSIDSSGMKVTTPLKTSSQMSMGAHALILASWEAEIERIMIPDQPRQKSLGDSLSM
jgi:hypothetical protein